MSLNYSTLNETECKIAEDCEGDCVCVSGIGVCLNENLVAEELFKCSCSTDHDCPTTDKCDMVTKKCWVCQSEAVNSAVHSCGLLRNARRQKQRNSNQSKPNELDRPESSSEAPALWSGKGNDMNITASFVAFTLIVVVFMIFIKISIVRRRSVPN